MIISGKAEDYKVEKVLNIVFNRAATRNFGTKCLNIYRNSVFYKGPILLLSSGINENIYHYKFFSQLKLTNIMLNVKY